MMTHEKILLHHIRQFLGMADSQSHTDNDLVICLVSRITLDIQLHSQAIHDHIHSREGATNLEIFFSV